MKIVDFDLKFVEILNNIENTNYSSIISQLKLIVLVQELNLTNNLSKKEIINIIENIEYEDLDIEAQNEAFGEFISNIKEHHKCKSILDDYGQDYIEWLLSVLKKHIDNNDLFNECNR